MSPGHARQSEFYLLVYLRNCGNIRFTGRTFYLLRVAWWRTGPDLRAEGRRYRSPWLGLPRG